MNLFKKIVIFGEFSAGRVKDALYEELWRACAGPLVDVPKAGERVYYFPQGHMEQVCYVWKWN